MLAAALESIGSDERLFAPLVEMHVRNLMWGLHRPQDALSVLHDMRAAARDEKTSNELVAEEGMVLSYGGRPLEALDVLGALDRRRTSAGVGDRRDRGGARTHRDGPVQPSHRRGGRRLRRPHPARRAHRDGPSARASQLQGRRARLPRDASTSRSDLALRCYADVPRDAPPNAALWFVTRLGRNAMVQGKLETAAAMARRRRGTVRTA